MTAVLPNAALHAVTKQVLGDFIVWVCWFKSCDI